MLPVEISAALRLAAETMASFRKPWALCGGWAVDAWLGRQTRPHADLDITILDAHQRDLFEHLRDWNLVPHDAVRPENREIWTGWRLELPAHIHARPPGAMNRDLVLRWVTPPYKQAADGLDFDFVLNREEGDAWVLSEVPRIAVPLTAAFREADGVLVVAPVVLAFHKATAYLDHPGYPRPLDLADFDALVPLLGNTERAWLRESIALLYPDHAWLPRLSVVAR